MRQSLWIAILCSCVLATASDWAKPDIPCAPEFEVERGILRGRVYAADTETALEYANIVATQVADGADSATVVCGDLTGPSGDFSIDLPPGTYTFKVLYFGYHEHVIDSLDIRAGEVVDADAYLDPIGLSLAESAAETLGIDAAHSELDLRMEVKLDPAEIQRGDSVRLSIAIRNQGDQEVVLPETMDGSSTGSRYPIVEIDVEGPAEGFKKHYVRTHGNVGRLQAASLHFVQPGETFDATPGYSTPYLEYYVEFLEPGLYTIIVRFLMDEPDLRRWWGLLNSGPVPPEVSELLRKVPQVDLVSRCELRVR